MTTTPRRGLPVSHDVSKDREALLAEEGNDDDLLKNFLADDEVRATNKAQPLHHADEYDKYDSILNENFKRLREKYPMGGLAAYQFIDVDVLMNAPIDYFLRFEDVAQEGTKWVQSNLSERGQADVIGQAQDSPEDEELQNKAFSAVQGLASEFLQNQQYRGIEKVIITYLIAMDIIGLSRIDPIWRDRSVDEIICNGPYDVQIEISGRLHKLKACQFRDTEHLLNLLERVFGTIGKTLSRTTPYLDGRLYDQSRIAATHPTISPEGPNVTIRRHPEKYWTPRDLVAYETAPVELLTEIGNYINKGCSFVVIGGTGSGKELRRSTPIPTPSGWKTMGEIEVGDSIFDHHGNTGKVSAVYPQPLRQVFKITFDTQEEFFAGADHNWFVSDLKNKNLPPTYFVKTTQEMLDAGVRDNLGRPLFAVPLLSQSVQYDTDNGLGKEPHELDIHPYLLGRWLASERVSSEGFFVSEENHERLQEILHSIGATYKLGRTLEEDGYWCLFPGTFDAHYRVVPLYYEMSAESSRRLLISGLLDSGGSVDQNTGAYLFTAEEEIARSFMKVSSSLGYKTSIHSKEDTLWTISVYTDDTLAFSREINEAHQDICFSEKRTVSGFHKKTILSIEPLSVEENMVCITVDTQDATFLVGDGYTTTHNTSLLNAMSGFFAEDQRILTLEDTLELRLHPKKLMGAPMETLPANRNRVGDHGITMRELVRASLRMRPDGIVIGEVRDAAMLDLCQALNTGHWGASTVHANSPAESIYRMQSLVAQSGEVDSEGALPLIASAFDFIIMQQKFPQDGSRKIAAVCEIAPFPRIEDGRLVLDVNPLWEYRTDVWTGGKVTGQWVKVGNLSEIRRSNRLLDLTPDKTWEELLKLSDVLIDKENNK